MTNVDANHLHTGVHVILIGEADSLAHLSVRSVGSIHRLYFT